MVSIVPTRLHWFADDGEDKANDYCAHSPVDFCVGNQQFVSPDEGDWTVSASAIILLRSLFSDHKDDMQKEEHVFPCCGHEIWPKGGGGVTIFGCPNGVDFGILHQQDRIELKMSNESVFVSYKDWRNAVVAFLAAVKDFYDQSSPKNVSLERAPEGFLAMMVEWDLLIEKAQQTTS